MAKASIPDWFDLKRYETVQSAEDWLVHVDLRYGFFDIKRRLSLDKQKAYFEIISGWKFGEFDMSMYERHTNPFPVRTMNSADLAIISASWTKDDDWRELHEKICSVVGTPGSMSLHDEVVEMYRTRTSLQEDAINRIGWLAPEICHGIPISINLDADDETLKLAFSIWLAGARAQLERNVKKAPDASDFARWQKFKILAVFDLYQWAELYGVRLTHAQIANSIWPIDSLPNEERDVDMTERLRRVARPLMEQVIDDWTVRSLAANIRLEKYLDEIVEKERQSTVHEQE